MLGDGRPTAVVVVTGPGDLYQASAPGWRPRSASPTASRAAAARRRLARGGGERGSRRGGRRLGDRYDAGPRSALYAARVGDAANPSRIRRTEFDAAGARVVSTDGIAIAGVIVVEPARALAQAVPLALSRPALEHTGLTALYVD